MRCAIDAPTFLRLVDDDVRVHDDHRLVSSSALRSGALELLLVQVAAGERDEASATAAHDAMTATKVRTLGDRVSRRTAWAIARERGWTSLRHAELLAVCRLQADVLVTVDPELARLADGIVDVVGLDRLTRPDRDGSERRPPG